MCSELLRVEQLKKYFPAKGTLFYNESGLREKGNVVHAVDGVSFLLERNSTLGVVGESGCGKTTLARAVLMLTRPTSGDVYFEGSKLAFDSMKQVRPSMQIVFQDPYSSLDPRMRAKDIVAEPLNVVTKRSKEVEPRVREALDQVGLGAEHLHKFPNELSGGQRQRLAIGRAVVTRPKLVVLDEPTSALDASTQAQILNLLQDLQEQYQMSYLFISHNVNVVRHMSNRIAVMYMGKIVETASADELMTRPRHPYTCALISSVPTLSKQDREKAIEIKGETPSAINPPPGCTYNPRCPYATSICREEEPRLEEMERGHYVACYHPTNLSDQKANPVAS
jgi:oligopeptide/dipeptide ABC transporter ATP-binding protein